MYMHICIYTHCHVTTAGVIEERQGAGATGASAAAPHEGQRQGAGAAGALSVT